MSDGPHKTLQMRPKWKALSRRADNRSFATDEVTEAVCPALAADWSRDVSDGFLRKVRVALGEDATLFPSHDPNALEGLRSQTGSPLEAMLIEAACDIAKDGYSGQDALEKAAEDALLERSIRGIRQVEELWLRESPERRATNVRSRLEASIAAAPIASLVKALLAGSSVRDIRAPKRDGLEDGVQIDR